MTGYLFKIDCVWLDYLASPSIKKKNDNNHRPLLDFLVKFISQVLKWYMFPGIVLTTISSALTHPPPNSQESKWKETLFF